ncbi:11372_t:CDS:2, partial [Dentiscutata heterogama]
MDCIKAKRWVYKIRRSKLVIEEVITTINTSLSVDRIQTTTNVKSEERVRVEEREKQKNQDVVIR